MGSLAPQGSGSTSNNSFPTDGGLVIRSNEDESFAATTIYANALIVDLQEIVDNVIQFHNNGANDIEYKIYASPKVQVSVPVDADDSWYNILNVDLKNPSFYDDDLAITIENGGKSREGLSNRYAWARVQIRSTTSTSSVKIWHRGTVP